ncbi:MAG: 4-hydroxythreonine-4-phosphate dehydrogenase PdxA [Rhodospirillales bacterium]|nr:4-hydroxythreonine-4-phosphate dehydrogenase PdxA [Rhodospirillales bacterium]
MRAALPALTMGEPAGIGPELAVAAWRAGRRFLFVGDPRVLGGVPVREVAAAPKAAGDDAIPVLPVPLAAPPVPGRPDPANAPAVIASIETATRLALAGDVGAIVTNPIQKSVLTRAGFAHPGHTEFLAQLTGTAMPVMMLASAALRVVPITIHVALRRAIAMLDADLILRTARITDAALRRDWGLARPRLAFAGLNPHAGEDGTMGDEEERIIRPALAVLRAEGIEALGPFPADTMFTPSARRGYDVALGMYHDQVLTPIKTLDMHGGVNVTLGLPIVRTSPDHGTALDIAGKGVADPGSVVAALDLAVDLVRRRKTATIGA